MRVILFLLLMVPSVVFAQGYPANGVTVVHQGASQIAIVPPPGGLGERNSAGWGTGYSVVTSTQERPNPLGYALGGSKTVTETTTKIVPNDALGNPIQPILPLWP